MSGGRRPSLVEQVREGLLNDLVAGGLEPGAKLPNENVLAERFAVSRATVREAVLRLLEAGYLARRHGSGTYVTAVPRTRHPLETTVSYTAMIRDAGHKPGDGDGVRVRSPVCLSDSGSPAEIKPGIGSSSAANAGGSLSIALRLWRASLTRAESRAENRDSRLRECPIA